MKASRLKSLLIQLSLVGGLLFCFSFNSTAQSTSKIDIYGTDKVVYVSPDVAVERLNVEIDAIKSQMAGLNQGSQQYKNLQAKLAYFQTIHSILTNEKAEKSEDIADAISRAMGVYASDAYGDTAESQKNQNKQAAIELLRV